MRSKPNTPVLHHPNIRALLLVCVLVAIVAPDARAAETKTSWQQQWEKTVQWAKKEGQVTVYVHSTYAPALESGAFQKAFPELKLVSVSGIELQLERRFLAERRAGKNLADVFMVGVLRSYDFYQAKLLEPIKTALILPEVVNESKWWQKTHHYADPEKKYLFRYVGSAQLGQIFYNTRLVNPNDFNSFWDFLNPKWKGKIEARDIRAPGTGAARSGSFIIIPRSARNSSNGFSAKPTSPYFATAARDSTGLRRENLRFAFGAKESRKENSK